MDPALPQAAYSPRVPFREHARVGPLLRIPRNFHQIYPLVREFLKCMPGNGIFTKNMPHFPPETDHPMPSRWGDIVFFLKAGILR